MKLIPLVSVTLAAWFLAPAGTLQADEKLKIFILAGQSNMVGHANPHTMTTLYHSENARDQELARMVFNEGSSLSKSKLEAQLALARKIDALTGGISGDKLKAMPDGPEKSALEEEVKKLKHAHEAYKNHVTASAVISDQVYIHSIADRSEKSGKLGVGFGGGGKKMGPEFGFGLSMARKLDGPILLIKTSWGGKSLHYNFRPPSAGAYQLSEKEQAADNAEEIKKNAGLFYRKMNESIQHVLANLNQFHPAYNPQMGFEIAGFVWFQGFNDQFSPDFRDNYASNMISFIHDVRQTYQVPNLPFVIGVLGTPRTPEKVAENPVSLAQRKAAQSLGQKKNVIAVESYKDYAHFSHEIFSKGWPKHYHEWDLVGSDRPYHYLGSGTFFVRLGDSFAHAMLHLRHK